MLMNLTKKDIKKLYNLMNEILFCIKCTTSNQRPHIVLHLTMMGFVQSYTIFLSM